MSDFGHHQPNPDLPDDLAALGEQLHDALVARAGDDPPAGTAWVAIEAERGRRRFRVRPIQLLAAAAVVVLVAISAVVLLRRDEVGVTDVAGSTVPAPTTSIVIVPGTDVGTTGPTPPETIPDDTVTLPSTTSSSPSSTTTSTSRPTTTTSSTTTPPTAPSTTVPVPTIELRGDGVGVAKFGDGDEATVAAVRAVLGPPTEDTGWGQSGIFQYNTRHVRFGNLTLDFADEGGPRHFAGWQYDSIHGNQQYPLPNGLTLGMSAAQVNARAPQPVTAGSLEGSTGSCFVDHGTKICAAFDPAWQKPGLPTSGTVVVYVAGINSAS